VKTNFHITCILTLLACEWSLSRLGYLFLLNNMAADLMRSVQGWPASTHKKVAWVVQHSPAGHICVCIHQKQQKWDSSLEGRYLQRVSYKSRVE